MSNNDVSTIFYYFILDYCSPYLVFYEESIECYIKQKKRIIKKNRKSFFHKKNDNNMKKNIKKKR